MDTVRRTALLVALALVVAGGDAFAQSCAMCASSFGQNDPAARAMSWSILFMMATPYAVVGTVAAVLVYFHRRAASRFTVLEHGRAVRPSDEGEIS
jgi:heme/copper-type cytochrome/quinol oxidase subunit 2